MRLQVKGKNVEVTDSLKDYALQKLGKLDKHLNDAARLELELQVEKNPSISRTRSPRRRSGRRGRSCARGKAPTT